MHGVVLHAPPGRHYEQAIPLHPWWTLSRASDAGRPAKRTCARPAKNDVPLTNVSCRSTAFVNPPRMGSCVICSGPIRWKTLGRKRQTRASFTITFEVVPSSLREWKESMSESGPHGLDGRADGSRLAATKPPVSFLSETTCCPLFGRMKHRMLGEWAKVQV